MPLTPKQAAFVTEYLVDLNATQAAIRAGYSERTAQEQSSRLLSKAIVADEIKKRREKIGAKIELTVEKVLAGLMREADREGEGSSHSARVTAWSTLGKHLGMFAEKVQVTGQDGGAIEHSHVHEIIHRIVDPKQG